MENILEMYTFTQQGCIELIKSDSTHFILLEKSLLQKFMFS